jgi:hypothetical protein
VSSDIDILLIAEAEADQESPEWMDQVSDLADQVRRWTGNHAQMYELSPTQFQEHLVAREPIVQESIRDAVALYGPEFRQLRNQFVHRGRS